MLTGIYFLLTYTCNLECDPCFAYSSPGAKGTFTLNQIQKVLAGKKLGTVCDSLNTRRILNILTFPMLERVVPDLRQIITNRYLNHCCEKI